MERKQQVTSELVVAYWQCPRKAFLLFNESQQVVPQALESIVNEHQRRDRYRYLKRLKDKFGDVPSYKHGVLDRKHPVLSDAELEYEDLLARVDVNRPGFAGDSKL